MLTIEEKAKVINCLIDNEIDVVNSQGGIFSGYFRTALTQGFKGYASLSDEELLRALNKIAKNGNYSAQQFLATLSSEKFLL